MHHIIENGNISGNASDFLNNSEQSRVLFLNSQCNLQTVIELFEDYAENKIPAPIIIVTKKGTKDEPPLGIITVYDLARMVTYLA